MSVESPLNQNQKSLQNDLQKVWENIVQESPTLVTSLSFDEIFDEFSSNITPYNPNMFAEPKKGYKKGYLDKEGFREYFKNEISPSGKVDDREFEEAWQEYLKQIIFAYDPDLLRQYLQADNLKKPEPKTRDYVLAALGLLAIALPHLSTIASAFTSDSYQPQIHQTLGEASYSYNGDNNNTNKNRDYYPIITTQSLLLGGELPLTLSEGPVYCVPFNVKASDTYTITVSGESDYINIKVDTFLSDKDCPPMGTNSSNQDKAISSFPVPFLKIPTNRKNLELKAEPINQTNNGFLLSFKAPEDGQYSLYLSSSYWQDLPIELALDSDKILLVNIKRHINPGDTSNLELVSIQHRGEVTETIGFKIEGIKTNPPSLTIEMSPNITITLPFSYEIPSLAELLRGVPITVTAELPPLSGFERRTRVVKAVLDNRTHHLFLPVVYFNHDNSQPPNPEENHVTHAIIIHGVKSYYDPLRPIIEQAAFASANLMGSTGGRTHDDVTFISADPDTCARYRIVDKCIDKDHDPATQKEELFSSIYKSVSKLKDGDILHVLLEDHGVNGKIIITPSLKLNPADIVTMIKSACPGCEIVLLHNACESGYAIQLVNEGNSQKAIIATSTDENDAYTDPRWGDTWSQSLHYALNQGMSYIEALKFARYVVVNYNYYQSPQLDANKDGIRDPFPWSEQSILDTLNITNKKK